VKKLPDEKTQNELLNLAQDAEQKAKALCDLTAEIDEKWRVRLELKRKVAMQKFDSESI
jgi:coenzyme F420-reducing hydrogenase alpha subunit